jgi:hypothetical protein
LKSLRDPYTQIASGKLAEEAAKQKQPRRKRGDPQWKGSLSTYKSIIT